MHNRVLLDFGRFLCQEAHEQGVTVDKLLDTYDEQGQVHLEMQKES